MCRTINYKGEQFCDDFCKEKYEEQVGAILEAPRRSNPSGRSSPDADQGRSVSGVPTASLLQLRARAPTVDRTVVPVTAPEPKGRFQAWRRQTTRWNPACLLAISTQLAPNHNRVWKYPCCREKGICVEDEVATVI